MDFKNDNNLDIFVSLLLRRSETEFESCRLGEQSIKICRIVIKLEQA